MRSVRHHFACPDCGARVDFWTLPWLLAVAVGALGGTAIAFAIATNVVVRNRETLLGFVLVAAGWASVVRELWRRRKHPNVPLV